MQVEYAVYQEDREGTHILIFNNNTLSLPPKVGKRAF